jgi:Bacterial lectin/Chitobiase/beta-hexosaminidase C-terminal domain
MQIPRHQVSTTDPADSYFQCNSSQRISRWKRRFLSGLCFLLAALTCAAQSNIVTYQYDNFRTGQNTGETTLTPSNVNVNQFGKLFSLAVDGQVYAQPLYVPGVTITGKGTHNVLIVATENDTVYAFDADVSAGPLWRASLVDAAHGATSGETALNTSATIGCTDLQPSIGITSTPVIDTSSGTIYVEAKSVSSPNYFHRLHALDIGTGNEKFSGPVQIKATVPGTGDGATNGQLVFDSNNMALHQHSRAGLLLMNGTIFVAFAGHCDFFPYHGWVFAYDAATLTQRSAFVTTPNGGLGGIWMGGAGLAADTSGNIYVSTGNGTFSQGIPLELGDSIVKLNFNGTLSVADYFTPFNQSSFNANDVDLGSGGVLLLPDQPGTHPHLLLQAGKEGRIYLIDRDRMTANPANPSQEEPFCSGCSSDPQIVQESAAGEIGGMWSTPAYWNNTTYWRGNGDLLKAIPLSNGLLDFNRITSSTNSIAYPGATPAVSANGTSNGIVWSIDNSQYGAPGPPPGPAVLHAHDAANVSRELWNSSQAANNRDRAGNAVKFSVPRIAKGKVYIGTSSEVDVYGLLNLTQAATPGISPASGTYITSVKVTLTDTTPAATITYTTDGSTPLPGSHGTVVSSGASFTLTSSATVKAIASASGLTNSSMASATYTLQAAAPAISPNPGTYGSPLKVTLSDTTPAATITYTTDGSAPLPGSHGTAVSSGASFTLTSSATVKAVASASGLTNSSIANAAYTVTSQAPSINFGGGFAGATTLTLNGGAIINGSRLRLTDGGVTEARSAFFASQINIQSFTNDFSFQLTNPRADGMTFTIQGSSASAVGPSGGGLGYGPHTTTGIPGIPKSIAVKFDLYSNDGEGINSTGWYTNGASPTIPAIDLTPSGVNLHSGDVMNVHMTYNGTTLTWTITDPTAGKTFTTSANVNIAALVGASTAFVGFTAGTGGATATQEVVSWSYIPGVVKKAPLQYETESSTVFNASKSSGPTYRVFSWIGFSGSSGTTLDGTKAGDSVTITLSVPTTGVYDIKVATQRHSTRGIVQLSINGTNVGPAWDQYSATDVWQEFDLGTVSLAAGNQPFKFTTSGKNASSLGFTQAFDYIKLTPQ